MAPRLHKAFKKTSGYFENLTMIYLNSGVDG